MSTQVRFHSPWLLGLLALSSCQLLTGLDELETSDAGAGGQASGGQSAVGGTSATGGDSAECLTGWETHECRGVCGDRDHGTRVGCGNLMDCYVTKDCLPETCSDNIDDVCGGNKVEGATPEALEMAAAVVDCMCAPSPP